MADSDKNLAELPVGAESDSDEIDYDSLRAGSPEALAIVDKANDKLEELTEAGKLSPDTLKELLTQFESAFTLDQKCVDALLGKAYVQGLLFTPEETRTTLEKALEVAPNDPRVLDMLEALLEQEDEDEEFFAADASAKDLKDQLDNGDMVLLGSDDDDENIGEIGGGADVSKLIAKDGVMTNRFREVLQEIFDRFSDDEHKKQQLWSDEALDAFHKAVNGTPIQPSSIQFLKENFETKSNKLTAIGFVQFYLYQTASDGAETLKDLKQLGYDENLNKL